MVVKYIINRVAINAVRRCALVVAWVRWTACARPCERSTSGPSYKEVGPPLERRVAHRTTVVICRLLDPCALKASPKRMFSVAPGNLITELILVDGHGSTILILSAHRHPAGNCGAGRLTNGYTREVIGAGPQIGNTHLRMLDWNQDLVGDGVALVGG